MTFKPQECCAAKSLHQHQATGSAGHLTVCPGTSPQGHPANGSSCSCWGGVGWRGKVGTPKIWMQSTYLQRLGHLGLSYQLGKQPTHKFKAQAPCSHLVRSFCASPWWHCSVLRSCLSQGSDESVRPGAPTPAPDQRNAGIVAHADSSQKQQSQFWALLILYFAFRSGLLLQK